jgi:hypothetical protein
LTWTFRPKKKITNKKENTYKNKFERAHTHARAYARGNAYVIALAVYRTPEIWGTFCKKAALDKGRSFC